MLEYLNLRTRNYIIELLAGGAVSIGDSNVSAFSETEQIALKAVSLGFDDLKDIKGADLAEKFIESYANYLVLAHIDNVIVGSSPLKNNTETLEETKPTGEMNTWRICSVKACSFRGLAPAGEEWNFDFNGKSHLLHGPNGCGKSSLLGAVSWCLTNRLFRDDGPPSLVENVTSYSVENNGRKAYPRPDALSLTGIDGQSTNPSQEFWVELSFVDSDDNELFIRRHNIDGLYYSNDGQAWTAISRTDEAGINELDVELQILMPAKVSHLKFGKEKDIFQLFSRIVGLDELEAISEIAGKACTALRRKSTDIEKKEINPRHTKVNQTVSEIEKSVSETMKSSSEYASILSHSRNLQNVESFGVFVNEKLIELSKTLASDLGIALPSEESLEYKSVQDDLKNLPGLVHSALESFQKPLDVVFPQTMSVPTMSGDDLQQLATQLTDFELEARKKISERLQWQSEITQDVKAPMMLAAAKHFNADEKDCPVCEQDLQNVPLVAERLSELRSRSELEHLKKEIDDLERGLIAQLEKIVTPAQRLLGESHLSRKLDEDWKALKANKLSGLLSKIADNFELRIGNIRQSIPKNAPLQFGNLAKEFADEYPNAFEEIDRLLRASSKYLSVALDWSECESLVREKLTSLVSSVEHGGASDSLCSILERGRVASEEIQSITTLRTSLRSLYDNLRAIEKSRKEADFYREVAEVLDATKELGKPVRKETVDTVKSVGPEMQSYYEKLYENEILPFKLLTAGHAANPDIKNEANAYLGAGEDLVPIGPFSNAGRLRALGLSFVFALLEKSSWSLDVLILDDPAVSLDDAHQARFANRLVGEVLAEHQIILATHYESFFKSAGFVFNSCKIRKMPRRSPKGSVSFEPDDLLLRLDEELRRSTTAWREGAGDLRIWAERVLTTFSGYSPMPFIVYNNLPASIDGYQRCSDPRIATSERDNIVSALNSPEFVLIRNAPHHDHELIEEQVRDALNVLKGVDKDVRKEISRLEKESKRDQQDRAIDSRPIVEVLSFQNVSAIDELPVIGLAAASTSGSGIDFDDSHTTKLEEGRYKIALARTDAIAPIAIRGQLLLLENEDNPSNSGDLVVVKTDDGKRYVRRFWAKNGQFIILEGANPTSPCEPVVLFSGRCEVRTIVGVLYDGFTCGNSSEGDEWTEPSNVPDDMLADLLGIEVVGTSMEPIARSGQTVLIREESDASTLGDGALACIDVDDVGTVIKRCYFSASEWFLGSINQNDSHPPIPVNRSAIRKIYELKGVLF